MKELVDVCSAKPSLSVYLSVRLFSLFVVANLLE